MTALHRACSSTSEVLASQFVKCLQSDGIPEELKLELMGLVDDKVCFFSEAIRTVVCSPNAKQLRTALHYVCSSGMSDSALAMVELLKCCSQCAGAHTVFTQTDSEVSSVVCNYQPKPLILLCRVKLCCMPLAPLACTML